MGIQRYDAPMHIRVSVRMTRPQICSLTAMAHAMSLTVGDVLRFAVDELLEDVPEPRLFTRAVHTALVAPSTRRARVSDA